MSYAGYKNYATWNVAKWIKKDNEIHRKAIEFMKQHDAPNPYLNFILYYSLKHEHTPDQVCWTDKKLDLTSLNKMMKELKS